MFTKKLFKEFDPELTLVEIETYYRNYEEHYVVHYEHKLKKISLMFDFKMEENNIIIAPRFLLFKTSAQIQYMNVHYAKKMKDFLENHPKNKIKFVLSQTKVILGKEYDPYMITFKN